MAFRCILDSIHSARHSQGSWKPDVLIDGAPGAPRGIRREECSVAQRSAHQTVMRHYLRTPRPCA
eukprot:5825687-Pleurochrysis_carterae.AAC.1